MKLGQRVLKCKVIVELVVYISITSCCSMSDLRKKEREREREREREKETKKQRNKETKKQREKKTKRQKKD